MPDHHRQAACAGSRLSQKIGQSAGGADHVGTVHPAFTSAHAGAQASGTKHEWAAHALAQLRHVPRADQALELGAGVWIWITCRERACTLE
jgi:hypothetical protein